MKKLFSIGQLRIYYLGGYLGFGRLSAACGCIIYEIGPIEITWLRGDCE